QVIQYERLQREPLHEIRRHRQMTPIYKDVERQAKFSENPNPFNYLWSYQEPVVRLALGYVPEADQPGMPGERLQLREHPLGPGLQIDPADHANDRRIRIREGEEPPRLLERL